jgi:hypothetical protein
MVWQKFSVKDWIVNILGFASYMFSIAVIQFWQCRVEVPYE